MSQVTLVWADGARRESGRAVTASDGEYELLDLLGRGGMATVYLARHRVTGRRVALKLVAPGDLEHLSHRARGAVQRRLLREARAVSTIRHPNVVEFVDSGLIGGSVFIVMEHLDGCSLADALEVDAVLPWPEVAAIGAMIASGVAAAHAAGIIHRDLKPGNVMLVPREPRVIAKVFDFGIAKLLESAHGLTLPGTAMGTPRYMSPEQCRGDELDHRTDIYSLGVLLYRALAGRCPFEATEEGELLRMHEEAVVPPLAVANLPPGFAQIVLRCLAKAPDARFGSMHEVAVALEGLRAARGPAPGARTSASNLPPAPPPVPPRVPVAPGAALSPPPAVVIPPLDRMPVPVPVRAVVPARAAVRRRQWAVRAAAGTVAVMVVLLAWVLLRSEAAAPRPPAVVVVMPPPVLPPPRAVAVIEVADVAKVASLSACWGRVQTTVGGRRKRSRPMTAAWTFVATCLLETRTAIRP